MTLPWRRRSLIAAGAGALAVYVGVSALVLAEIRSDWLLLAYASQVGAVLLLGTLLVRQLAGHRRTQAALTAANTNLQDARASLATSNNALRFTKEELKRARQQLIDGIEGLTDGLALYDADDRLVVCNSRYGQLFGLGMELLRPGTPFRDIPRAHVNAGRVAAAVGREDAWVAERLAQHRDPQGFFERLIDGHWYRFSDRPTSAGGTVTIFAQIDELKQREQRLHENQAILQSILDHIPVGVGIADRDRRIVLLNKRLEALYGVELADVRGRNLAEVRPSRYSQDSAAEDHVRIIETGEPILSREDHYDTEAGEETWITSVVPIKDEQGAVQYVLRTTMEVPQLAKANRELADYRAFLIEAERQAKIASCYQEAGRDDGMVWSENVQDVLGLPPGRLCRDADLLALIHPDDRERMAGVFHEITERPRSYDSEYRIVRPDGSIAWIRGIAKMHQGATGARGRLIGAVQDITGQKRIEEALRESEARLRAAQRRARLTSWQWDFGVEQRYTWSDDAEAIMGLPRSLLPMNDVEYLEFVHPDDRAHVAAEFARSIVEEVGLDLEYRICRGDGRIAWIRELDEVQRDASGRARRMISTMQDITHQKEIESALREKQALLLAAQRRARIAYWLADADSSGSYTASELMAEVLGMSPEAVPTNDIECLKLVHPEDRARVAHAYERAMTGRAAYAIEYRMLRSDGTFGWVRELSEIHNDAAGRPARMIGTIQDITEQKSTEAALRESEARLRGFLDHAPFAMYLKDTELRYQLVNRAVEQFQGMTAAEICGRTPGEVYPPALAERFMAEDHAVLARGAPVTFEYSDPTLTSYADSLTVRFPIRDSSGRIVALGGITQDISERKQAERALRDSEARLRAFMDNAPAAIAMKDVERRFVMLNSWIESAYGRPASELIGRRSVEIVASDGTRAVDAMEAEVIATGNTVVREVYFPERKELPWAFEVKFPVRNGAGDITGIGGIAIDISDRKRAEAERQRTETLLRSFMDNAPMAMAVKDIERRFVMLNAPVVAPYGRSAAEVMGQRTIDLSRSEGAKSIDAMEREVAATGRTVTREVHFEDRSVSPWTYEVKFPIKNEEGGLLAIGGIAIDISDRKRTDLALRDSEARLRRAQQQAKLAYWNWQLDADAYVWSPGSGLILGMPDADLPRNEAAFYRRIYSDDRDRMRRVYDGILAGENRYTAEFRIVRPDGEIVWVEEIGEVEYGAAGRRVSVAGIIQDITERKQAERALRDSEARLRRAQQQARLAYWTWQFAIERTPEEFHWSPGSAPLFGIVDQVMPKDVAEYDKLIHPDDLDRVRRLYADVRAGLDQYTVDYRVIHPDGKVVWVREIGEAVRDADGRRIGVEGTLQDITEQHALEEQLVQSQKMEAIGQLTGGIAHDFNNLLAVILGNLELLGEELPGHASARQKIDAALRSTLRGSDLTHRLLAYARRQPLAPKVTQVNELIRNMRDLVLRPLGPAIGVTFALGEKLWPTEIDQAQLETSLLNLVINARDAMPDGGRLIIETTNMTIGADHARHDGAPAAGDYVCIAVGDSGIGMSETVKARAFDPFFTTKGVGKGTGLGLSMVYGFVKQSGGHIELDSTIGSGTTVRIYLPRAKNTMVAAAAA